MKASKIIYKIVIIGVMFTFFSVYGKSYNIKDEVDKDAIFSMDTTYEAYTHIIDTYYIDLDWDDITYSLPKNIFCKYLNICPKILDNIKELEVVVKNRSGFNVEIISTLKETINNDFLKLELKDSSNNQLKISNLHDDEVTKFIIKPVIHKIKYDNNFIKGEVKLTFTKTK